HGCLPPGHLEIPASYAALAGEVPAHFQDLVRGDHIPLSADQSDEEVLAALKSRLADREGLLAMTDALHARVLRSHSTEAFAGRVLGIFREALAARRGGPA